MAISWIYRRLMEGHLYKPPFCADSDKNNESYCSKFNKSNYVEESSNLSSRLEQSEDTNNGLEQPNNLINNLEQPDYCTTCLEQSKYSANCFDQSKNTTNSMEQSKVSTNNLKHSQELTNSLEQSALITSQWKKAPRFQKKRVYYFSPAFFSKDKTSTIDSMYKFYLSTLQENYPNYMIYTNYYNVNKTDKGKIRVFSFLEKHNIHVNPSSEKLVESFTVLEKNNMQENIEEENYVTCSTDSEKQVVCGAANELSSISLDSTVLNTISPQTDIYSVDDQTYENFCLEDVEENTAEFPSNLLLKMSEMETEAKDMKNNDNCDPKCDFLTFDDNQSCYTVNGESQDIINTPDCYPSNYEDSKPTTFFGSKYFVDLLTEEEKSLNSIENERKFKSSIHVEKQDFSILKLFRKLLTIKGIKLRDEEAGNPFD